MTPLTLTPLLTWLFMTLKVNKLGVPAGTSEFHVFDIECPLPLPRQHQIIEAGARVRVVVSDYTEGEKVTF